MNHAKYILIGGSAGAVCGLGYKYGVRKNPKEAYLILQYASIAGASGVVAGFSYAAWIKRPKLAYSASFGFNGAILTGLFFTFRKITDHTDIAGINQVHPYIKTAGCGGLTLMAITAISAHTGFDTMLLLRRKAAVAYHLSQVQESIELNDDPQKQSVFTKAYKYIAEPTDLGKLNMRIKQLSMEIRLLEIELGDISENSQNTDSEE
ncbi:uncharacterized protein TRIADDRAFT_54005 [Trichoplax adhaerens]|uniref:Uncharacterized protein n=1 Tax=Trichoplax adhaerens TaxID=10228 RepID=B3RQU8_TRIAD|nr:predicted protein [Trichoplax adhaerens]EDV26768.1 predicted protein [Trichoplax adhaerens]|eukprot:XP_002110764.1 predicted protein [Trichoplax adhaerens]